MKPIQLPPAEHLQAEAPVGRSLRAGLLALARRSLLRVSAYRQHPYRGERS